MGRIIGFIIAIIIYGKTKNIWFAGFSGAIILVILEAIFSGRNSG